MTRSRAELIQSVTEAKTVALFESAYRELRPNAPIPEFKVLFFPFANLNNTIRLREGRILVRVSDLLEGAPEPVLHAIFHILIAKLYRQKVDEQHAARFRKFTGSQSIAAKTHLIRQMRGRKRLLGPKGRHYHLEEIFDGLNTRFFHGLMARPQMTWSSNHARHSLGHYDPAHNTIVLRCRAMRSSISCITRCFTCAIRSSCAAAAAASTRQPFRKKKSSFHTC